MVFNSVHLTLNVLWWEVSGTDLLRDTSCLSSLDISLSQFIKNFGFTHIYVTKDTNNRAPKL